MDPTVSAAVTLIQLGVAGVFLWAFLTDKLRTKSAVDEMIARIRELYDARIAELLERLRQERADKNEWKRLALGTERRLDQVTPVLATAIAPAVPSDDTAEAAP